MGADIEVALIVGAFFEDKVEFIQEKEEITVYDRYSGKPSKEIKFVQKVKFSNGETITQRKFGKKFDEMYYKYSDRFLRNENCFGFVATKQEPLYESPQDLGLKVDLQIEVAEKLFRENFPGWEPKTMLFVRFSY